MDIDHPLVSGANMTARVALLLQPDPTPPRLIQATTSWFVIKTAQVGASLTKNGTVYLLPLT